MTDTREYRARPRPRARDSLRWRLPVSSGILILTLVSTLLWAAYRQVETTLVAASAERATAASEELAGRLTAAMERATSATRTAGSAPALRELLQNPSDGAQLAARAVLRPTRTTGALSRQELWDTAGTLVLAVAAARADSMPADTALVQGFPAGMPPDGPGISQLKAAGDFVYYEITTEVFADTTPGAARLGYYRRFRPITSQGMSIQRLLGSDAAIRVGAPGSAIWTDFLTRVQPMEPRAGAVPHVYVAATGERWIGGAAAVAASPWQLWIGYPRHVVLQPARLFLERMLSVVVVFLALGVGIAMLIGIRITGPLHQLATAADDIAGGDYTKRVNVARRDEIGLLSRAFNFMTDRVETAYGELRTSHEQTHLLLATARIGLWESKIGSERMACSDSMRVVHGDASGSLPSSCGEFLAQVHADDRASMRRVLDGSAITGETVALQYRTVAADGSTHWLEGTAKITAPDVHGATSVIGVSEDVTRRRQLESQLSQAQKMEAVGQLAGGVAHDFNNLLTAIVGHAELLREELPSGSMQREDTDEILKAAASAAALTHQLLAFSRKQVRQPQVMAVNAVVGSAEKLLRRLIGDHVLIETRLAPDLDSVLADPGQIEQIVVNLVVNARDALPDGGTITITTAHADLSADYVLAHASVKPGRYVSLSVSDTGIGMDAETQRHLFEPFFTTKPLGKGTGLGLATVFGIVQQSGGHIQVVSEEQLGSTFTIFLPATADAPHIVPPRAASTASVGGVETILVVDDNAQVRGIATTVLQRLGYTVVTAKSGEEGLRIAESLLSPLHLLVTDVVMPGMTGPELARQLVALHPKLHVLFTSGYSGDAVTRHGIDECGAMFIEKPYTVSTLATTVRAALGGQPLPLLDRRTTPARGAAVNL